MEKFDSLFYFFNTISSCYIGPIYSKYIVMACGSGRRGSSIKMPSILVETALLSVELRQISRLSSLESTYLLLLETGSHRMHKSIRIGLGI